MARDVLTVRWNKVIAAAKDEPKRFRIASEGDSWFAFAFKGFAMDGHIARLAKVPVLHVDLATNGDTATDIFKKLDQKLMRRVLRDAPKAGVPMHLLLLSAGGNDLFGDAIDSYVTATPANPANAADWLLTTQLDKLLDGVVALYRDVVAYREKHSPSTLIAVHGYDYLARLGNDTDKRWWGSPWIWPKLVKKGLTDPAVARALAKLVLDRFHTRVLAPVGQLPGLLVVDTRNTLKPLGKSAWQDELHPDTEGYAALAECFRAPLHARFAKVF